MKLLDAYRVLEAVIYKREPLNEALNLLFDGANKAFIAEVCYGVCRYYHHLLWLQSELLDNPIKPKDEREVRLTLMIGLYQLQQMNVREAIVVNETVELIHALKKTSAKGLINATLRAFIKRQEMESFTVSAKTHFSHPKWLAKKIEKTWGNKKEAILKANNERAKMVLRVNALKSTRERYLRLLEEQNIAVYSLGETPQSIVLVKPVSVKLLPNFDKGWVSIQSESAQWTPHLMELQPGLKILDACSAPGMKSTHLLEQGLNLELTALDLKAKRLEKLKENLTRLELAANCIEGSALSPDAWWDGTLFDRILADVPCTATGVIRKHPDIKVLRSKEELTKVMKTQAEMLRALWPLLKKGGLLLYATCSLLPEENETQIKDFLALHPDARVMKLPKELGEEQDFGIQRFPMTGEGFYFSKLRKV